MKRATFYGRMNDGTEVMAVVHDLDTFVNAEPDQSIFVFDESGGQCTVQKRNVVWHSVGRDE